MAQHIIDKVEVWGSMMMDELSPITIKRLEFYGLHVYPVLDRWFISVYPRSEKEIISNTQSAKK